MTEQENTNENINNLKFLDDWERNNYCITLTHYNKIMNKEITSRFSKSTMDTISHIVKSINLSEQGISKISQDIIDFEGYTGTKTRHFYNNICDRPGTNYFEVGTFNGSSSIAAVYKNPGTYLFVDNWCQFGGDSNIFKNNIEKYLEQSSKYKFIENDCWKIDVNEIKSNYPNLFNVYLFDGDHAELDHFKALEYYLPILQDEFIFLVDDFNWSCVRDGTMRAIRELNLQIKFRHEIFMSPDDLKNMPNHVGKKTWWNGIAIFLLSK